ncbi:HlyD family secretion protein [Synechocystis sp. LKSZ1]|uniref:HlyD family secretion protein n=1 Tax=Synechocystis sp. LKSZ1 TaxID=3144951 RepID=UPI00336BC68D
MKRSQTQHHPRKVSETNIQSLQKMEESNLQSSTHAQPKIYATGHQLQAISNEQGTRSPNSLESKELVLNTEKNDSLGSNGNKLTVNQVREEPKSLSDQQEAEEPSKNLGQKIRRVLFLTVGLIALITGPVFAQRWWQFQTSHVSTDNAQIKGHLSPISAKISGTIEKVLVNDGDYVKAGQTLFVLQDQDLDFKIQQAEANLAGALAQLRAAKDSVTVVRQTNPTQVQQAQSNVAAKEAAAIAAQANINQALAKVDISQASVAQAQTSLTKAQADFHRYNFLYKEGAVSAQELDTARAARENAQSEVIAAKKGVAQAQAEVKNAQAEFQHSRAEVEAAKGQVIERRVSGQNVIIQTDQKKQAQAQVEQSKAALALARQQIIYTKVKAPINGYVGQLTAQVGQKVQAQQPVLSVVPLQTDEIYVDANFKETALGRLRIGEEAQVEVDAYPGEIFKAKVAGISPATGASFAIIPPDNATGNFNKIVQWVPVRLVFMPNADPEHKLKPGLSVKVTVDTPTGKQAISNRSQH